MQAPQGAAQVGPQGAAQVGAALQPFPQPFPQGAAHVGAQQLGAAAQQQLLLLRSFGRRIFFSIPPKLSPRWLLQQEGAQQLAGAGAQQEAAGAQQLGAAPQPLPQGAAQVGPTDPQASPQGAAHEGAESQQECRCSLNKPAFATLEPATISRAAVRVVHFILKSPKFPGLRGEIPLRSSRQ